MENCQLDYDVSYSDLYECSDCKQHQARIEDAAHFFEGVLKHLYGTGELDINLLQHNLEDVCHHLGVNFPKGRINIQRTKYVTPCAEDGLQEWVSYNNKYLYKIAQ